MTLDKFLMKGYQSGWEKLNRAKRTHQKKIQRKRKKMGQNYKDRDLLKLEKIVLTYRELTYPRINWPAIYDKFIPAADKTEGKFLRNTRRLRLTWKKLKF